MLAKYGDVNQWADSDEIMWLFLIDPPPFLPLHPTPLHPPSSPTPFSQLQQPTGRIRRIRCGKGVDNIYIAVMRIVLCVIIFIICPISVSDPDYERMTYILVNILNIQFFTCWATVHLYMPRASICWSWSMCVLKLI